MKNPRLGIEFTGEVQPAAEPQQLGVQVSLLNIMRLKELSDLRKNADEGDWTMSAITEEALNMYFETLPDPEGKLVTDLAHRAIDFMVEQQDRRKAYVQETAQPHD